MNPLILESSNDSILQEDLEYIARNNILLEKIKNKCILITGATGMIGSQIVKTLICSNRIKDLNIQVIALARNKKKAEEIFGNLLIYSKLKMYYCDILDPISVNEKIDYIIHGASITSSKDFVNNPVETIKTTLEGTKNILELAKEKNVKGLVYLSSLEIYGVTDSNLESVDEDCYGYLNILDIRSSYSESKRMAECMCMAYSKQYLLPIKIARLTQTFGAGVNYFDDRVFAQFARSVIEQKDIILHTAGETIRSYCYLRDAIDALFYILIKGITGEAYNVANEETTISIRDMAELVKKEYSGLKIKVITKKEKDLKEYGYNPTVKIRLNTEKLKSLGWEPKINLREMYHRMISSMINTSNNNSNIKKQSN